MKLSLLCAAAVAGALAVPAVSPAEVVFDFENINQMNSPLVSGNKNHFTLTAEQTHGGAGALKYVDTQADPHESWTYDVPFAMTSGVVSMWFHDVRGASALQGNPAFARWGGAIMLEDKNNPADFGAVEICELSYGGGRYYASEGTIDRALANDRFDSGNLPLRAVGFHKVEFHVTPTETTIYVDGVASPEVRAPGSTGNNLRVRVMADSPSRGGRSGEITWYTEPMTTTLFRDVPWVSYDDLNIVAGLPTPASNAVTFEVVNDLTDYDTAGEFQGIGNDPIPPQDNPNMNGFVNQWSGVTSAPVAHGGTRVAVFSNPPQPFQSLAFDLTGAEAGTTVTVWFYDALGANPDRDKAGGSIILESGTNPNQFVAVEILNYPYPSEPVPNYYLTQPGFQGGFFSKSFGDRIIGWHKVEFVLGATSSQVYLDGVIGTNTGSSAAPGSGPVALAPGLTTNPKLRLMGDSASDGGFANWRTVNELQGTYHATRTPYVYYDDVTLPVPAGSAVNDWMTY